MDEFIKIFKALSDKNRVRIVKMLTHRNMCVCEITSILNISNSTVSSHLSILNDAGLISYTKNGKWVEYHFNLHSANPVLLQILAMLPGWLNDDQVIKDDLEKTKKVNKELVC